jgi:hydroxymethylbilane synthase
VNLRIGTRGSALARRQVELAIDALTAVDSSLSCEVIVIQTEGDQRQDVSLDAVGGQGVFVKAIEQRLLEGDIDLAVHSLKDMPSERPDGLAIGALLPRGDARDALVAREGLTLAGLPEGARIGSDSRRRAVQLLAMRPDLRIEGIRGNVDTRLRKVENGEYDAVALAIAGLDRLGFAHRATQVFEPAEVIPAPGQAAIALQCRADDAETLALLARIDDPDTRTATDAERAFLNVLGAGCRLPVGAYAVVTGEDVRLEAVIADDAGKLHRGSATGLTGSAAHVGKGLAIRLRREARV